jgi:hypothetical protein
MSSVGRVDLVERRERGMLVVGRGTTEPTFC